jgi:uncharacterized protein
MLLKIHKSYRDVVAVCDSDLIGKRFEEGRFQLDVKESFYNGEEIPEERVVQILKRMFIEDATFNIVGKDSVKAAVQAGIIDESAVGEVQGVQFALILL